MMNAVRAANWDAMATMMHPDALAELRGFLAPLLELPAAAEFRRAVLGVESDSAARGLSNEEIFAGFVRFAMTQDPDLLSSMRTAQLRVLGHLMEGETAHVVSRVTISYQGISVSQMDVSSFREVDGEWRGLLSGDISSLAKALRDAVAAGAG